MPALASDLVLPEFEGPLDLLLHLVKKHELDIFNIPISFITEKYLQTLSYLQALNIDIAGEYLLMAATLLYLKSRELLPPEAQPAEEPQAEDEVGDPREALIKRLLEYQRFKSAAAELLQRPVVGRNVWPRGSSAQAVAAGDVSAEAPLAEIPVWELIELLAKVLGRTRHKMTHEVTVERLSLADRINELAERLDQTPRVEFAQVLVDLASRTTESLSSFGWQVVMTFMATLEMARLKLLTIYQAQPLGSIYIARVGTNPIAPTVSPNPQRELPLYAAAEHTAPAAPPEAAPTPESPETTATETAAETPETAAETPETAAAPVADPAAAPAGPDPDPDPPQPEQP
ncbi:MAG: segregation/condensation protein A [Polyangia bacterium]